MISLVLLDFITYQDTNLPDSCIPEKSCKEHLSPDNFCKYIPACYNVVDKKPSLFGENRI